MGLLDRKPFFLRVGWASLFYTLLALSLSLVAQLEEGLAPFSSWKPGQLAPLNVRSPFERDSVREELRAFLPNSEAFDPRFVVRRGEGLTQADVLEINRLYPQKSGFRARAWLAQACLFLVGFLFFHAVLRRVGMYILFRFRAVGSLGLVWLLTVLGAKLLLIFSPVSVLAVPLALPAVLFAPQLGPSLGMSVHMVSVFLLSSIVSLTPAQLVVFIAAGWIPVFLTHRESGSWRLLAVTLLGGLVGEAAMGAFPFNQVSPLLTGFDFSWRWESDLVGLALGTALVGVLAALFVRVAELAFGNVPKSKLQKLLDLDRPLLAEFIDQAPGTYQHVMAVANMAEKLAHDIGADDTLVRVGAYYHDVGKMQQPEFFAENQKGENPHDRLTPEDSAQRLRDHIHHGVAIAKGARLPQRVIDFIIEHHGRSCMDYFLDKAARREGQAFDLCDFEYDGRNPTSKETAILMIADAVEAASRSLKKPSPEDIQALLQRVVFRKLFAGTLDDSGLTPHDLHQIGRSLEKLLEAQFHTRVTYPWQHGVPSREPNKPSPPASLAYLRVVQPLPETTGQSPNGNKPDSPRSGR